MGAGATVTPLLINLAMTCALQGSRKAVDINLCKPKGLSKHCVNVFAELRLKFSASMDSSAIAKAKEASMYLSN